MSKTNLIWTDRDFKIWAKETPGVEELRPKQCPGCGTASRPVGGGLAIYGHGLRERQQWGPATPDGAPENVDLKLRRYECQECGAVITVTPSSVRYKRLYSAQAIGMALALFGLLHLTVAEVRARISPWKTIGPSAHGRWKTLLRWAGAIAEQRLFRSVRKCPESFSARKVAERAAATLSALCRKRPPPAELEVQAFLGATHAR